MAAIILDADVIIKLYQKELLNKLSLLYDTLYIPVRVKQEIRKKHSGIILYKSQRKIFTLCTARDTLIVKDLSLTFSSKQERKKKRLVLKGEAEMIQQLKEHMRKGKIICSTDDRKAKNYSKKHGLPLIELKDLEKKLVLWGP